MFTNNKPQVRNFTYSFFKNQCNMLSGFVNSGKGGANLIEICTVFCQVTAELRFNAKKTAFLP